MTAWIGIIGTVIGAIIGGGLTLLNAHLQTRRQVQQDRRKLILSKLEELHEAISEQQQGNRQLFIQFMQLKANHNDSEVKQQVRERRFLSSEKIQMLVGFYAPELSQHLKVFLEENLSFMDSLVEYSMTDKEDENQKKVSFDLIVSKHEKLASALTVMQMELVLVSKKYI